MYSNIRSERITGNLFINPNYGEVVISVIPFQTIGEYPNEGWIINYGQFAPLPTPYPPATIVHLPNELIEIQRENKFLREFIIEHGLNDELEKGFQNEIIKRELFKVK